MYNIENIINAANYEELCDFSIVSPYDKITTLDILRGNANIFCKTDYIEYLFDNIRHSNNSYNLITHHSDYPIDDQRWSTKPKCIKRWLAINPIVLHTDLIAIPLGIKTHKQPYYESQYMTEWFAHNINRLHSNEKVHNVYCNWSITNLDRNKVADTLRANSINITHDTNIPFNEYIERMSTHKFVISPPGNGIDCHRTWEALYVGCIPIVIKNHIYSDWLDLPILQVNTYDEITQKLLDEFSMKMFSYDKLRIAYWKQLIN